MAVTDMELSRGLHKQSTTTTSSVSAAASKKLKALERGLAIYHFQSSRQTEFFQYPRNDWISKVTMNPNIVELHILLNRISKICRLLEIITKYFKLSKAMKDFCKLLQIITDYWRLSKTIEDYQRLLKTIEDNRRLSIEDYRRLSWTINDSEL